MYATPNLYTIDTPYTLNALNAPNGDKGMENDIAQTILAIAAFITAIGALWQRRVDKKKAEAAASKIDADTSKAEADAATIAFNLAKDALRKVSELQGKVSELQEEFSAYKIITKAKLEEYQLGRKKDRSEIQRLRDGINRLIGQLETHRLGPIWKPGDSAEEETESSA